MYYTLFSCWYLMGVTLLLIYILPSEEKQHIHERHSKTNWSPDTFRSNWIKLASGKNWGATRCHWAHKNAHLLLPFIIFSHVYAFQVLRSFSQASTPTATRFLPGHHSSHWAISGTRQTPGERHKLGDTSWDLHARFRLTCGRKDGIYTYLS
jgi:hypothetical protein